MINLLNKLIKVITWLTIVLKDGGTMPINELIKIINHLLKINKSRGTRFTIMYMKAVRADFISYLSGSDIKSGLVSLTRDGIPKILGNLIPLVRRKSYLVIAMICTILWSSRALSIGKNPNYSSITSAPKGTLSNILMFSSDFWKELGYRQSILVSKKLRAQVEVFRSKSGPNGHALASATADAKLLPLSLIKSLGTLGGPKISFLLKCLQSDYIQNFLRSLNSKFLILDGKSFRRLSSFADKEDKVRTIGILD